MLSCNKKVVKSAVRRILWPGLTRVAAIPLGRGSPTRLGAPYPPAPRVTSMPAYSGLLRVEIARFTRRVPCDPRRLVSVALILASRRTGVTCYAALCSPDVPPAPGFPYGASDGLAGFTAAIIRARTAR